MHSIRRVSPLLFWLSSSATLLSLVHCYAPPRNGVEVAAGSQPQAEPIPSPPPRTRRAGRGDCDG
jgi:hypothetical protein